MKKKKKFGSPTQWTILCAVLVACAVLALMREDKIVVLNLEWQHEAPHTTVTFDLKNNSHERQFVSLLLIAQRYSSSRSSTGYSMIKTKEVMVDIDSRDQVRVEDSMELGSGMKVSHVVISVEILRVEPNKPVQTMSAVAARSDL